MEQTRTMETLKEKIHSSSKIASSSSRKKQKAEQQSEAGRNKSGDVPFPVIYFGFILSFLLFHYQTLYDALPSLESFMNTRLTPKRETIVLPLTSLFVVCPLLAIWRNLIKNHVASILAKNWAGLEENSPKFHKFCEQAWLATHYTIATSIGFFVLHNKPWFPPAISEKAQYAISATQKVREKDQEDIQLQILYSLQLGFYSLELITLFASKHRRSDATVYFLHHFYTLFLMAGSWISYNHRVGSLVLFLHDIGDIFLPIGKCFSYGEEHFRKTKTREGFEFMKTLGFCSFVLFVIGFAIPRLLFFGALIYQGFTKFSWYSCCGITATNTCVGPCIMGVGWPVVLQGTLGLLYPLHVFWFYLIVKMAWRLILLPGEYDDVRSDDEE